MIYKDNRLTKKTGLKKVIANHGFESTLNNTWVIDDEESHVKLYVSIKQPSGFPLKPLYLCLAVFLHTQHDDMLYIMRFTTSKTCFGF